MITALAKAKSTPAAALKAAGIALRKTGYACKDDKKKKLVKVATIADLDTLLAAVDASLGKSLQFFGAAPLAKAGYDPSQPRDGHGLWSNDPSSGKVHPYGPGHGEKEAIKGRDWAQADLAHLTETLGPNHPDTHLAAASVQRLEGEVVRIRSQRVQAFEQKHPPGDGYRSTGPSNRFSYAEWQNKQQAIQRAGASTNAENLALHQVPPGATRAKVAEISGKVHRVVQGVSAVLSVMSSFTAGDDTSTLGRVAAAATALTTIAVALNIASRARNAPTLVTAVTSAKAAIRRLRTEMPHLATAAATIDKPRVNAALAATTARLWQLDRSMQTSRTATTLANAAVRGAFYATGGKIIPAPAYRPRVTSVTWRQPKSRWTKAPT